VRLKKDKKGILTQFKEFISRGNILDLAVGVIIGQAFQKIVAALTEQIIMPTILFLSGSKSLAEIKTVIGRSKETGADIAIYWGAFIQAVIDFILIAAVLFVIMKTAITFQQKSAALMEIFTKPECACEEEEADAVKPPSLEEQNNELLREIRDLLKEFKG